ncbi:juvenile hormone esterase-like isoform X2 [Leguminivora glycinivorella]|uniref:juvenile hormone esterase-like isoform X2 n=1 Tax=Leguminivora glycinivorella TaxID=1035111 RepID=UPI00200D8F90|nr:juvenile hormone esterase-like isoform X2 [Leguminivora glycinivorella]
MISAVNAFLDDLRGGRMTEAPVVRVEHGELQGKVVETPNGKSFYSFQGIPYAKPPLGTLRFQAPQPLEPWDGVRDATSEGNISAQIRFDSDMYEGDENCLYLNVYTPSIDGEFLPVMVYIHGGGLQFGSGSASSRGADYLVEKDVVVVTINYRCGALGFLSLNTPEIPGNAGLKDMIAALRWVKENINNFGGNSGNITLFGESAGGASVSVLTASPLSKDLISKAIIQSGNGLSSWAWQKQPLENAKKLAHLLGCESDEADDILEFLRATPAKEIVEATRKLFPSEMIFETGVLGFTFVVEKEFPGVEAAITESFTDLLTSGRVAEIPVMIGSTTLEFLRKVDTDDLQVFIPNELNVQRNSEEALEISNKFKSLYFKGNHTAIENLNGYFELISDKLITVDTHRYVQYLVHATTKPVYYYKFDYVGELNNSKKLVDSLDVHHAGHADELGYLFKSDSLEAVEATPQDIKMRERMLRLWTNFAKSGNPTPDENHYITVTWHPVTKDNLYYLNLSNELSLNTNPDKERMALWDELYNRHFKIWEHPQVNKEETPVKAKEPVVIEPEIVPEPVTTSEPVTNSESVTASESVTIPEPVTSHVEETTQEPTPEESTVVEQPQVVESPPVVEPPPVVESTPVEQLDTTPQHNGVNGTNGDIERKPRPSNEIKMVQNGNGVPKDVIRANDPPEDDLPKNIGVNKFVNFFESLGGKK